MIVEKNTKNLATTTFEDRIIIFIDLIGFGEFSKKIEDPKQILDFYDFLHKKSGDGSLTYEVGKVESFSLTFSFFSDTIVISFSPNIIQESFPHISSNMEAIISNMCTPIAVKTCQQIQHAALKYGLLTRGAITYGKIFHDSRRTTIFGAGLIDAYQHEKKVSLYPRVILSKNFENHFLIPSPEFLLKSGFIIQDSDGFYYVNYLAHMAKTQSIDKADVEIRNIQKMIIEKLQEYKNRPEYYVKWRWFAQYFNRVFVEKDESLLELCDVPLTEIKAISI